ncbi:unnamed protein product [Closterium sp. NIES-54]
MGDHAGQTCGKPHTHHCCFSRLDDAWRAEFGDEADHPHWAELLRSGVAIFDLDYDVILAAMYVLSISAKGDCYLCVLRDLGIEAAALGASESALPGTATAEALHTFTLDSGASCCFFRDSTTLTPLSAPVPVRLADLYGGLVLARSFTVLPCPADAMVTTTTPRGQRVSICTCTRTGRQLASFTRRPRSSLYTLAIEPPQVDAPLPPLPPSLAPPSPAPPSPPPPCLPCVEGQQRAASHSSSFPPTTAPLQTLHMDVGGPARVTGQSRERYFLLVVDEYTRYTTVFPLCGKDQVPDVLITWIRAVCLQLREPFRQDLLVLRLHFDRGASPQQNGIAERHIGLVMEVARTSMIHAAAPHFLWPFAVQYATHQLNLWPCVSLAETSPTLRWTGEVGDASMFRVWGSRAFVRDTLADKLSARRHVSRGTSAGGAGAGGAEAVDLGAGGAGAGGAGGTGAGGFVRPRPYFVPLFQKILGVPSSTSLTPPLLCPPPDQTHPPLQQASLLHAPSPYTEQSGGLAERREFASCRVLHVRISRRVPRSRPPPVPGTHAMALRPSYVPLRVPLPPPPESSLLAVPDTQSDLVRAASPAVSCLLGTAVTNPSFQSAVASALVAELLDFAAACCLDYTTALFAESATTSPPSVGGECALGTDVLEDTQEDFECLAATVPHFASMLLAPEGEPDAPDILTPRSYAEAITGPNSSQWQAAMDAEMASWKSTGTYVDEFPPPGSMACGSSGQRHEFYYFQNFSPIPKMTTLWLLLHVAAKRDYELHSLDFSTAFLQGLHKEIWLRCPPGFTRSFPAGTQWSLRRPVYGLRQAPREWHDTLRTTLAALGFAPSTADPSLSLCTDTSLPPFYVLFYLGLQITRDRARRTITLTQSHMVHQVLQRYGFEFSSPLPTPLSTGHSLIAPPSDESVEPSGPYLELMGCLMVLRYLCSTSGMGLMLGGRGPVVLTGHADASWVDDSATQRSSQGYSFSLGSGSFSWRSTRSSSVLSSSGEAEIYAGAMAAQELHWLTYLLSDLGEQPCLPPNPYVDNKAMIALC